MTSEQIQQILFQQHFPGATAPARLVETHISWVILTPDFAFKIKKPVQFDFLDFSTLEKRRFYCAEELRLNRRLAPTMYLDVLPIGTENDQPMIGSASPPMVDYALQMRRMNEQRQMDLLLAKNQVTAVHQDALVRQLADFHQQAILDDPDAYRPGDYQKDFEDLYPAEKEALQWLGPEVTAHFSTWRKQIPAFLHAHASRLRARLEQGFWVDGHGDLHTRNIFLTETPVVFDCIEFNPHFRRLDVLNDLAFLCMDLEARDHSELAQHFMAAYRRIWDVQPAPEDELLFLFFKAYRANIRLKVQLLELRQQQNEELLALARRYWLLLKDYCGRLNI